MKRISMLILISILICSCAKSRLIITNENQNVEVNFIDNPKKIKAGKEYYLNIIDKENPKTPLYPTTNNGSISRKAIKNQESYLYILKPHKSGTIIMEVIKNIDGKVDIIDKITIK